IKQTMEVVLLDNQYTSIQNNVVHIPKWEKLEIGVKLPQEYNDAITNFFNHYYTVGVNQDKDLNPYADDSLILQAVFNSPTGGAPKIRNGFFMRMAKWDNTNGDFTGEIANSNDDVLVVDNANALSQYCIRFRFAPTEESTTPWTFSLSIKAPNVKDANNQPLPDLFVEGLQFICDPELTDNKGFLSVNPINKRYFKFDNGETFFGIGNNYADNIKWFTETNSADVPPKPIITYKYMQKRDQDLRKNALTELHTAGANWMRIMLFKENYSIEHEYNGVYDDYQNTPLCCEEGIGPYVCSLNVNLNSINEPYPIEDFSNRNGNRQAHAWAMDDLLDQARQQNMYLQICIDPYHAGNAYQNFQWGDQCYFKNYVEKDYLDNYKNGINIINAKKYFISNPGQNTGSLYYWKRMYKYYMARYGYSVNIGEFEMFNEIDGTLTWSNPPSWQPGLDASMCASLKCAHPVYADPLLKPTINNFINEIVPHAKNVLGQSNRIFSLSYLDNYFLGYYPGLSPYPDAKNYFNLLDNSNIDVADMHAYSTSDHEQDMNAVRHDYTKHFTGPNPVWDMGLDKPYQMSEGSSFMKGDLDISFDQNGSIKTQLPNFYNNYETTFHNTLWSSVFMGTCVNTMSWFWPVVHWVPKGVPEPLQESKGGNLAINPNGNNTLNGVNVIQPEQIPNTKVLIDNHKLINNYTTLNYFINQTQMSFDDNFVSHKKYYASTLQPNLDSLEVYYLTTTDLLHAYGWVHNVKKYWQNECYYKTPDGSSNFRSNYYGCKSLTLANIPPTEFLVDGLLPFDTYDIDFYSTWSDNLVVPNSSMVNANSVGQVSVQMTGATIGWQHDGDYAFRIKKHGLPARISASDNKNDKSKNGFDFYVQPNPNNGLFQIIMPKLETENLIVSIYNQLGVLVYNDKTHYAQIINFDIELHPSGVYHAIIIAGDKVSNQRFIKQ
ncbi:MAG TPA: T9SS type A sorting domain-containing protein, partial [Bacteroidia bacterium]|nr:T9SS type A sorting domain-containing protein [Bacteroidia bacterium]